MFTLISMESRDSRTRMNFRVKEIACYTESGSFPILGSMAALFFKDLSATKLKSSSSFFFVEL